MFPEANKCPLLSAKKKTSKNYWYSHGDTMTKINDIHIRNRNEASIGIFVGIRLLSLWP